MRISPPLIRKTTKGMGYGYHVDDAQIGPVGDKNRSDISMTVFLCDPEGSSPRTAGNFCWGFGG